MLADKPAISILTVNYHSRDFVQLLVESVARFDDDVPIVMVDNSAMPERVHRTVRIENQGEKSHGAGINLGLQYVGTEYVLILDADCHVLGRNWRRDFLVGAAWHNVLTVAGPPQKPLRPACVFLKADYARRFDWRATAGYRGHRVTPDGFDVGIRAYHAMVRENATIKFLESRRPSRYATANGEEYLIGGIPTIYHHWHGSHLRERAVDFPSIDLQGDKDKLFRSIPWKQRRKML